MKKVLRIICATAALLALIACFTGCSKKYDLEYIASTISARTVFQDPVKTAKAMPTFESCKVDVDNLPSGWEKFDWASIDPSLVSNDLFFLTFNSYESGVQISASVDAGYLSSGNKNKLSRFDVYTRWKDEDYQNIDFKKDLSDYVDCFYKLYNEFGDPQIANVDVFYSEDVNVPIQTLRDYLDAGDLTHGYYTEWKISKSCSIGLQFHSEGGAGQFGFYISLKFN